LKYIVGGEASRGVSALASLVFDTKTTEYLADASRRDDEEVDGISRYDNNGR